MFKFIRDVVIFKLREFIFSIVIIVIICLLMYDVKDNFIVLNTKIISRTNPHVISTIGYDPETLEMRSIVKTEDETQVLFFLDEYGKSRKYNESDDKGNNLVILSKQNISSTPSYTLLDPKTSVMYNIVYGCDSSKAAPMYNEDGSLKLYNQKAVKFSEIKNLKKVKEIEDVKSNEEAIKLSENKEINNIKEYKNMQETKEVKKNNTIRKVREYKEIEETGETKKIKTIIEIEEYKEIKKTKLNKTLDRISNVIDNIKNMLD